MKPATMHQKACAMLGASPDKILLVGPTRFKEITGYGVGRNLGYSTRPANSPQAIYVRQNQPLSTYIHELLHVLFPSRPHWWIFAAAARLVGESVPIRTYGYGHALTTGRKTPESRARLITLARAAAHRRGLAGGLAQSRTGRNRDGEANSRKH